MGCFMVTVLGSTEVTVDGAAVALRPREASVAAALALTGGPTSVGVLIDLLWDDPPASAAKTLHNHVARLRRAAEIVATGPSGYQLVAEAAIDRDRFEALTATDDADPARADALTDLLNRWSGPAFDALQSHPSVEAERARLAELRLHAEEQVAALRLLTRSDAAATALAEELTAAEPFREHRWWLLMLARHRAGRRRDALEAYQQARTTLIEGSGIEPGAALHDLEARILDDDEDLSTDAPLIGPEGPLSRRGGSITTGPPRPTDPSSPRPTDPPLQRLALHLAESHGTEAALDACRRAADDAFGQHAFREAADLRSARRDLLERLGSGDGLIDADIDTGEAMHLAGIPEAAPLLSSVADRAEASGDLNRAARALLCLCRLGLGTDAGRPDPMLSDRIDRLLEADLRPEIAAELAGAASLLHSLGPDPTRCRDLFDRAEAIARARAPHVLGRVLPYAFLGVAHPDQLDRRSAIAEELVAIAQDVGTLFSGLHQRFSVQVQRGDPGFRGTHEEMVALAEDMDDPGHRWTVAYDRACVSYLDGDLETAEAAAVEASMVEGISPSRRMATFGVQLVALRRQQGRLAELRDQADGLVRDQPDVAGWRAVAMAASAAAGDLDRASALGDEMAADGHAGLPDDYTRSGAALLMVEAVTATGDRRRIERDLPLLDGLRGRMSWVGSTTLGSVDLVAGRAEAALGDRGAAMASFTGALHLGRRMGSPPVAERAVEELAVLSS